MDIAQEMERAIPAGPPLPPPETRAATGRTALRRRRAALTLASAGLVAAVVVPVALATSGDVTRGQDPAPPVSRPSSSGTPPDVAPGTRLRPDPAARYPWGKGEVVVASPLDGLLIRPGAVVLERRDDLYPGKDTRSVALRLTYEGAEHWEVWEWDEGGSTGVSGAPDDPFYTDFEDFVAKATSDGGMTHGPPPPSPTEVAPTPTNPGVRWNGRELEAGSATRIIEQQLDPDLPAGFAPAGATTAAAYVEMDGVRSLVLFREDGGPQLISVEATGHGDDLAALLAWARGRYRSGEGLL